MKITLNSIKIAICALAVCMTLSAHAVRIVDNENTKAVGHVKWHKEKSVNTNDVMNAHVPDNAVNVVFIRQADQDPLQTSANIAINDRFQVSIQPGNFSQVYSCSGINQLSSAVTGAKHNDLLANLQTHYLSAGQTYYFYVEVDDNARSTIKQIDDTSAKSLLEHTRLQTHQISRVVPNCPAPAPAPIPAPAVVKPAPVSVATTAKQTRSIELAVLFDTDKSVVKSQYHDKIKEAADFLASHPNATVVIEGHTDSRASEPYNQALSERRANAVRNVLIKNYGVNPDIITAEGHGELRPIASNNTAEGRQQNRRVVAVFTY
ncbi:OmpA family protein [Moraxella lacunata]|uniref:Cell envelope biogenesis protein OmpA n=1 Tax=Moraxella lacunata TaxID=477 RepID=A0A1V4H2W3_MORLA|nr:OmpA family protein [Moraxella lacunata]OPH38911.1 cell envelope biogenesis protein OmpA [Moraxella lacunata]